MTDTSAEASRAEIEQLVSGQYHDRSSARTPDQTEW